MRAYAAELNGESKREEVILTWHMADDRTVTIDESEAWFKVALQNHIAALRAAGGHDERIG